LSHRLLAEQDWLAGVPIKVVIEGVIAAVSRPHSPHGLPFLEQDNIPPKGQLEPADAAAVDLTSATIARCCFLP
jgi:hypothetical protein